MKVKSPLLRQFNRWRLLTINLRLASIYIPLLLLAFSVFSLAYFSANHGLQREAFFSDAALHYYYLNEGALIGFALFTIFLAFYKKNYFFIIASAWIFCNLKLGGIALGLDNFWLQQEIPASGVDYLNQLFIGAYFILSQQLIQVGLSIAPSSCSCNRVLGIFSLSVFLIALIPYPPLFSFLLPFFIPVGLALALFTSIHRLHQTKKTLPEAWQIMLLTTISCGLLSYVLDFFTKDTFLLSRFIAFIFLLLTSSIVVLGLMSRFRELRITQMELRANYQNSPFAVIKIDPIGRILRTNRAFRRLCAKLQIPTPDYWQEVFASQDWMEVTKKTQKGQHTELQITADVSYKVDIPLLALHANTIPEGYVLTLQDITLYMNTLQRLRLMANHDPVTNALNQRGIDKLLKNTFDSLRENQPCYVAYLDINHIHYVNRAHGHAAGDRLLQEISLHINSIIQNKHSYGRIDSDDFVFLFTKTNAERAKNRVAEITHHLNSHPISTPSRDHQLNVHMGLIEVGPDMDAHTAVRTAHGVCMDARRRNVEFLAYDYHSKELQEYTEELQLFELLEKGITHNLFAEMQPLMNLQQPLHNIIVEVLLRVRRNDGSLAPLYTFIPAAEENGTISIIDRWVFVTTLNWMQTHQDQLDNIEHINVNISGHSLNDEQFVHDLFVILDRYTPLLPKLCVEITEGVALDDLRGSRDLMQRLKAKGVKIALDDFGAGYTSFSYLCELPAQSIKIDGSLIKDMMASTNNTAIVRTIVELAKNLGMQCVAEWVEDIDTLDLLRDMGVNYAQGWVVSAARQPEEILNAKDIRDLIQNPTLSQHLQLTV